MRDLVVIGLGHIGGSIAAAARARKLFARVAGVERDGDARAIARDRKLADIVTDDLASVMPRAELVVVAVPPRSTAERCVAALAATKTAVVTDVAGVKARVVEAIPAADARRFVGGHPLAGTAGQGPASSDADLFEGRTVVLTPSAATESTAVSVVEALWQGLGATTVRSTPEDHDRAIAATSHLPHALAFALARTVSERLGGGDDGIARTRAFAGPSFLDATRVAESDPARWAQLFADLRLPLSETLSEFSTRLRLLSDAIAHADSPEGERELAALLTEARTVAIAARRRS